MPTLTLEPTVAVPAPGSADAIDAIQAHLDKEARNRRQTSLLPKELCALQKVELVEDLMAILTR